MIAICQGITAKRRRATIGYAPEAGDARDAAKRVAARFAHRRRECGERRRDGEMTSWYGSRAIRGLRYLAEFAR